MERNESKAPLVLMEQVIMVLVFALVSAVCIQAFALARTTSLRMTERDHAMNVSQTLAETVKYPHICFPKCCGLRLIIDDLFEKSSGMPEIAYEILEDNSMAGLVAQGFGIAVMPEMPLLKSLAVDVLEIKEPSYERFVYMAIMKNKYLAPIVKHFADYVEKCYKEEVSK